MTRILRAFALRGAVHKVSAVFVACQCMVAAVSRCRRGWRRRCGGSVSGDLAPGNGHAGVPWVVWIAGICRYYLLVSITLL